MTQSADRLDVEAGRGKPDMAEKLSLMKWHLERYDRLRTSTAARASVVLSAGAILSAGNAVVLARVLAGPDPRLDGRLVALFGAGLLISILLVIVSLLHAIRVLVAPKSSRETFTSVRDLPSALVFNDADTLREFSTFADFQTAVDGQEFASILQSAQGELWIGIQQHRRRYLRLRGAAQALSWAAMIFVVSLAGLVVTVLVKGI